MPHSSARTAFTCSRGPLLGGPRDSPIPAPGAGGRAVYSPTHYLIPYSLIYLNPSALREKTLLEDLLSDLEASSSRPEWIQ
jgi:hypothetical protein